MIKVLVTHAVNDELIDIDMPGCEIRFIRTGIGKVKSAMRLMDAIWQESPDIILNIGTAGTLKHKVGDIFVCRNFVDRDLKKVECLGLDYTIDSSVFLDEKSYCMGWEHEGVCNTGDSFLTEVTDAEDDVFDMEAYAQAQVCILKEIPFVSVKYVTDVIGQNSVKHWVDKLVDARMGLSEFFSEKKVI